MSEYRTNWNLITYLISATELKTTDKKFVRFRSYKPRLTTKYNIRDKLEYILPLNRDQNNIEASNNLIFSEFAAAREIIISWNPLLLLQEQKDDPF